MNDVSEDPSEPLPVIVYVDEIEDERDNFFTDAFESGHFSDIHLLHPEREIDDIVQVLLNIQFDALICDFNLTDAGPVNYSGEDLVAQFLSIRADFPCFIRTSFEELALESSNDVNRIYSKAAKPTEQESPSIFQRIALQISHHREQLQEWRSELEKLIAVESAELNAEQIEKIIYYDSKIESYIGDDVAIPSNVKLALFGQRDGLIQETEKLVADMRKSLNE